MLFQRKGSITTPDQPTKRTRKSRLRRTPDNPSTATTARVSSSTNPPTSTTSTPPVSTHLRRRRKPTTTDPQQLSTGVLRKLLLSLTALLASCLGISLGVILFLEAHPPQETNNTHDATLLRHGNKQQQQQQQQQQGNRENSGMNTGINHNKFDKEADEAIGIHHQQQHAGPKTIARDETNVIDMRVLNYELPFTDPDGGVWKQGWDLQPSTVSPLNVYVVPHSHCDPGWIKTFDEYFQQQTREIITTVIQALAKDPKRKFIWAEISYFSWWWEVQDEATRDLARKLLRNHQLEFVTGGWVQPDEANSELYAMELQLQEGHDWIRTNLGEEYIPHYGWAIDPFGYSPTMAWLLHKYGFRGMLIQRVHYAVKKELARKKHLEFYWRQTWDRHGDHDIFTHVMPFFSYDVPHTCGPDPSVCCQFDFKRGRGGCPWHKDPKQVTDANVEERAMLLWDQYQKKAALYRSNTVLVPLGDDFRYQTPHEAEAQYTNYQKMFDYINENVPGAHVQFGTLSEYFQAVMGSFEAPILKGSFFTYSDVRQDYWSGYFTSRVFDKALDRMLERALFAAETMGATKLELQAPRRALSLFQHHDGVTGTAKNHVVEDYAKRMYEAIGTTRVWMAKHAQTQQQDLVDQLATTTSGGGTLSSCWKTTGPRELHNNICEGPVLLYNPLETPQKCGSTTVEGHSFGKGTAPCETVGPSTVPTGKKIVFDSQTGMMIEPVREQWKYWAVKAGGAYLFVPGELDDYELGTPTIQNGGYVVETPNWKRTVIEREVPSEFGSISTVIDLIYETNLSQNNQEWLVRFSGDISNNGYFHTDLNGFNFDTHRFRPDMPVQSQVFPMPTLASIEDVQQRMTVLSEHAQGTASLVNGAIDVWLDRRLQQDDGRGLGQGVQDNRPTRTRFRLVLEQGGFKREDEEFDVTPLGRRMWDELQHPLEMFGKL